MGKVVGFHDGGTVTVLEACNIQVKIRLDGIDKVSIFSPVCLHK